MFATVLLGGLLPLAGVSLANGPAYQVAEINQAVALLDSPRDPVDVEGTLFFFARTSRYSSPTFLFTSLGGNSKPVPVTALAGYPYKGVAMDGVLYFVQSHSTGCTLWRSDGTAGGTLLLFDPAQPPQQCEISNLTVGNGELYFVHDSPATGRELWKSDGTAAGTALVRDINPAGDSTPHSLTAHDGSLFFAANDGIDGYDLWKSDGTAAGTTLVKEFDPTGGFGPGGLTSVDDDLYFFQTVFIETGYATDLWKTDGTTEGTVRVAAELNGLTTYGTAGGRLFFANDELWTTDGTEAGTQPITEINPSGPAYPDDFVSFQGELYFSADDGVSGIELWKSDGSAAGTERVVDLHATGSASPTQLTVAGNTLYFTADDGISGRDLWKSDGTPGGTVLVYDQSATPGFQLRDLTRVANSLVFLADESIDDALWVTDGVGAEMLSYASASPQVYFGHAWNDLYFLADDGVSGYELWKSDGTESGTEQVADINPSGNGFPDGFTVFAEFDGALYFAADDGSTGSELWKTDGTPAGTVRVADVQPGGLDSWSLLFGSAQLNGALFFPAFDGFVGRSGLWKSDGTPAGTERFTDLDPQTEFNIGPALNGNPNANIGEHDGLLYFGADDGASRWGSSNWGEFHWLGTPGRDLWKSDGSAAGTEIVADLPAGNLDPRNLVSVGGTLFFTGDDGENGVELWTSDGTAAGTAMLVDIHPTGSSEPENFTEFDGALYFTADDGTNGRELWKSDGTAAGTQMLADIHPTGSSWPWLLGVADGLLYFKATDDVHGRELWRTDGSPAGTELFVDLVPGGSGDPWNLTSADGNLYFIADGGLWFSDGSASGTARIVDIANLGFLEHVGDRLLFPGGTLTGSNELWALEIDCCDSVPAGLGVAQSVLGGAMTTGGVDLAFDDTSGGVFTARYDSVPIPDAFGVLQRPGDLRFGLASDPVQLWELEYTGEFTASLTLTFAYDDANLLLPESALEIYHFDSTPGACPPNQAAGCWKALPLADLSPLPNPDPVTNRITVVTGSLSQFALGGPPQAGMTWTFSGAAEGGSIQFTIGAITVTIDTWPGMTHYEVAAALEAAINDDYFLSRLGYPAARVDNRVLVFGPVSGFEIDDPGLDVNGGSIEIPALSGRGTAGLIFALLLVAIPALRRAPRVILR